MHGENMKLNNITNSAHISLTCLILKTGINYVIHGAV